ncbi:MAG: prepilin-type N-terminal cleavage/methylation domain-containing protein [Candidatus Nealsonbacteria bacterium]|nr:prepilin-type N-terminal cleavage/methylation domain-containing protein [Candidatus Nealsonbacteria bacterium]
MKNRSFTLIELLVVIAIIGVLASVVLVSMAGLQRKAKITKGLEFSQSVQRALGAYAVGVWSFEEGSGITAKDSSGYNNNGTINGGAVYTDNTPNNEIDKGQGGYALNFDGIDDYVDANIVSGLLVGGKSITYEAWVYPISFNGYIVGPLYGEPMGVLINNSGLPGVRFFDTGGGGTTYYYANSGLTLNKWSHIAVTFEPNIIKFYINGQLDKSNSTIVMKASAISNIRIGQTSAGVGYFNGLIDEVKIYEQAISVGQVQQRYAEGLAGHKNIALE